jgi:hypothetical protein
MSWPAVSLMVIAGCTPTLDWREVRVDDGSVRALFPCRPERQSRVLPLGGLALKMEMSACAVDGVTYAASWIALEDPAAVTSTLRALQTVAAANIGATANERASVVVDGMTPNPLSGRLRLEGRLPDGSGVQEHALFMAKGLRVYQLSVIGKSPPADAVQTFVAGIRAAK